MRVYLNKYFKTLQNRYDSPKKNLSLLLLIFLFANFILLGIIEINNASDPEAWDTTAYLGEANFIKNNGGIPNFLNLCLSGNYKQANQHPLYILMLTPFASTDISFFINAKFISLSIGLVFLLVVFFLTKKMFGDLVSFVTVFALILNILFLEWTTLVACESLLMLFSFLFIYFVIEGFNNNKYWAYAGVFAGLAYLTKGTSLILLPGFVLSVLFIHKLKSFRNKYFWIFFILFGLVASPLLIRNILVYQNPFFNVNNYIVTYGIENLNENRHVTFNPNEGATLWKFDKSEMDSSMQNSSINNSFDLLSLTKEVIGGMRDEINPFFYSFNIGGQRLSGVLSWVSNLLLLLFFIIGLSKVNNNGGKIYFLATILIFLIFLSFNPIDRYFLPLASFIWIYAALGIFTILDLINKKIRLKYPKFEIISKVPYFLILVLLLFSAFMVTNKTFANPMNSVEYSDSRLDLLKWLRTNLKENEKYTLGPNFNWQLDTGIWILPPQNSREDFSKFDSFIHKHQIRYVILEWQSINNTSTANFKKLIKDNFLLDPEEGIIEKKPVAGWELVYKDHKKPVNFLVYELVK